MPLSGYPNDNWGKDEYREDVKWYLRSMVEVNQMDLTAKKRGCCKNITKAITESTRILKNSGRQLSKRGKQRLYELAVLRFDNLTSLFVEE